MINLTTLILATVVAQSTGPLSSVPAKYLPPNPSPNKVVVSVNGIPVTAKEVDSLLWTCYSNTLVEEMINNLVVKSEAQKQSVKIAQKTIEAEVTRQIKLFADQIASRPDRFPPGMTVDRWLQQQGMGRSRITMDIETQMLLKSLI